ncbi:MAG: lipoate--protein ligase family protein [Nitrososphaeria archaeon]|nr:lipoate--protein ligase family protein [Nitrososphaeria archaeon]
MGRWRLLVSEGTAQYNMALDEAILTLNEVKEKLNVLRLYIFKPSAITIGYFQKVYETVNVDYAYKNGVPIVRRITGGGAVFHDENGEITYSVIAKIGDIAFDIQESYRKICNGILFALNHFGLEGKFEPVNDVIVNGKKVSGSAQTRKVKTLLQHGTLMYNTDLSKIEQLLIVPKDKLASHSAKTIYDRVTTLSREKGVAISRENAIKALKEGFEKAFSINLVEDDLDEEEKDLAERLVKKYSQREWNFRW